MSVVEELMFLIISNQFQSISWRNLISFKKLSSSLLGAFIFYQNSGLYLTFIPRILSWRALSEVMLSWRVSWLVMLSISHFSLKGMARSSPLAIVSKIIIDCFIQDKCICRGIIYVQATEIEEKYVVLSVSSYTKICR